MSLLLKVTFNLSSVLDFSISIISTIGIATIASTVGAGGLGTILFDGMRTQNVVKIVWGTFLSVVMVLGVNGILKLIEKRLKKKLYQE